MDVVCGLTVTANRRGVQIFSLSGANFSVVGLSFFTSVLLAKLLGAESFGDFRFIQTYIEILVVVSSLGLLQANARAALLEDVEYASGRTSASLLITIVSVIVLASLHLVLVYGASLFQSQTITVVGALNFGLLLGAGLLLSRALDLQFQSQNRITNLILVKTMPKLLFVLFLVLVFLFFSKKSSVLFILVGLVIAELITPLYFSMKEKVGASDAILLIKKSLGHFKGYGFPIYVGSLFALGFAKLNQLLPGVFATSNVGVGYFSLAMAFASPVALIPNSIASVYYRDFAQEREIPLRLSIITGVVTLSIGLIILPISWFILEVFFDVEFEAVYELMPFTVTGAFLFGVSDFVNRFIGSKGLGVELRNSSVVVGLVIFTASVLLTPSLGAQGACIAYCIGGFAYLMTMIFYYVRYLHTKGEQYFG